VQAAVWRSVWCVPCDGGQHVLLLECWCVQCVIVLENALL
jgi:hypothetical protein